MKKIFVAIVAVAAISFTACNNASKQDIEAANADSIEAPAVEDEVAAEAATEDVADVDATTSWKRQRLTLPRFRLSSLPTRTRLRLTLATTPR